MSAAAPIAGAAAAPSSPSPAAAAASTADTMPQQSSTARPRSAGPMSAHSHTPSISKYSEFDESPKTAVKVAVRVRPPLSPNDPALDLIPNRFRATTCDVQQPATLSVNAGAQGKKVFVFDRVFGAQETQDHVWSYVNDSVRSFVQGYNVSILAYGQSGAGKSYTMGTANPEEQHDSKDLGIVPRAAASLFEQLGVSSSAKTQPNGSGIRPPSKLASPSPAKTADAGNNWQVKATYVEIYNEQLRDLLVPDTIPANERSTVAIREDTKGRIIVTGAQQVNINSIDDLLNALNFGSSIRQTDATAINSKSSRSHAVFSLNLIQKRSKAVLNSKAGPTDTSVNDLVTVDSKLHFVDLAGSERLKNSGLTGERVKEGIAINAGLASLAKVISQLSSRTTSSHVSYRDSRLTRLLQDSLGGNAITYMIACINPVEFHLSETLNTVLYATRARNIQSRPQIQQRAEDGDKQIVIDRLRSEIAFLRDQIRLSERSERKNGNAARSKREIDRENELQNQLLDVQENYSALSQRHAKLISELAQSKGGDLDDIPALKEALGNNATSLDRLNRSNNFAEAVEAVVLEYEKTIQSLESSLSNSRAAHSTSESSLLEREAKIVYLEAVAQQLQSRIQKAMDREANNESYLRELETKLEGITSGDEKLPGAVADLRKELTRMRESETSAEEYISTLEERLAEAEQDTDIMAREIKRLEAVVERQRIVGKMDGGLKAELDSIRPRTKAAANGVSAKDHHRSDAGAGAAAQNDDMFHDRLVATTSSAEHPNGEMTAEGAEAEWKSFGPMEGEETASERSASIYEPELPARSARRGSRYVMGAGKDEAQWRLMAEKLETVTMELFEIRADHETTTTELEDVSRKYEIALSTLAELQDAMDEARTARPTSFLGARAPAELKNDLPRGSARVLSSDMSSIGGAPTLVDGSEGSNDGDRKEETLADAVRRLRRANAEKDINMAELTENYSQLQDQHKDTLNYIEELKEEMSKLSPGPHLSSGNMRRSVMGMPAASKERESRLFDALRLIAQNSFEDQPENKVKFEKSLNAAVTESHLRTGRQTALEAELAAVRKEMEIKNTMISGLTRERSARPTTAIDMSIIATVRGHLMESQQKIAALQKANTECDDNLIQNVKDLRSVSHMPQSRDKAVPGGFEESEDDSESNLNDSKLQAELEKWEEIHRSNKEVITASEQALLNTISDLEATLANAESTRSAKPVGNSTPASVSYETEKVKHIEQVQSLQREIDGYKTTAEAHSAKLQSLENSYTKLLKDLEQDAKTKELTETELQGHRDLVLNLEHQIEQQKSLSNFHQQGLAALEDSHAKELDELKATLDAERAENDRKLNDQFAKHQATTTELQEQLNTANLELAQLMHSVAIALNEEHDNASLHDRIKSIAEERASLVSKQGAASDTLNAVQAEMQAAKQISIDLEYKIKELTSLNDETMRQLEKSIEKESKSTRLVQELEEQLSSNYDQHREVTNRLSMAQKDTKDREREIETHKGRVSVLESQLNEMKRMTQHSVRSYTVDESTGEVSRNPSTASHLRKTNSHQSLPASPPPAVPLPPLPGNKDGAVSPSSSRHQSRDMAGHAAITQQQLEESESRVKQIEKHLAAEKQLTSTLEEALVDLETQANRTKADVDAWKKKCKELEEEASGLRKERGTIRNSLQAVEEERDRRIRAEQARRQLEERMEALGKNKPKKKNAGGLNCF